MLVVDPLVPAVAPQFIINSPVLGLARRRREHRGRADALALDPEDLVAVADGAVQINRVAQPPKLGVPGLGHRNIEQKPSLGHEPPPRLAQCLTVPIDRQQEPRPFHLVARLEAPGSKNFEGLVVVIELEICGPVLVEVSGPRGNQISGAPRHRRDAVSVAASARWRRFHAIDATLSPWPRRLDGAEAHEGPR